jgi:outer membrane protein assembly factor BamB/plastocyanin
MHRLLFRPFKIQSFKTICAAVAYLTTAIWARAQSGTVDWSFATGGSVLSSGALTSGGSLYFGSYDQNLYAVTASGGSLQWKFSVKPSKANQAAYIYCSPVVGPDATIYFGTDEKNFSTGGDTGNLYALKPNGTLKWKFATPASIYSTPAVGEDGTIYFGCFDNNLYALNPDGTLKWKFLAGSSIFAGPVLGSDGTVYFGCDDHNMYALTALGAKKWAFDTGGPITTSPTIGPDGTIYLGSTTSKTFFAVNPDGTKQFEFLSNGAIYSSAALGADGTIYFGSDDGSLYALHSDGSLKWQLSTGDKVRSSPALASDGTVYVGSYDNHLYAVSATGALLWSFPTANYLFASAAIGGDGRVYIGSADNSVYAIKGSSPMAASPWPTFRHDSLHTGQATAISVSAQPSITTQPLSQTVNAGQSVTFSVAATGSAPLSYQWRWNGQSLASQTSASLTLTTVTSAQQGTYDVTVSNSAGTLTSAPATLTVNTSPSITTQPLSQTVNAGQSVTFTVAATGSAPLSYQWRWNGQSLASQTSASLTLAAVTSDQQGTYDVIVSNSAGTLTSSPASLTVASNPVSSTSFTSITLSSAKCIATFAGTAGQTYLVLQASNLGGTWQTLETIGPVSNSGPITVEIPITGSASGFLRIQQ